MPAATVFLNIALILVVFAAVGIPLFLLLGYLSLAIWRGILMRKFQPFYIFLLALPLGVKYSGFDNQE